MNDDIAIKIENVSKKYKLYDSPKHRMKEALHPFRKKYHKDFYALKDINLEVKKGEILGIVGRNGSGKSTLLKIISGVLTPTTGTVQTYGRVSAILELGSGFNPNFTGIENIYHNLSINGFRKKEIDQKVEEIIDFSELGQFINQPVKTYSSGMKAKLAFAVSTSVDPDILILDEVLSVGDALFRRKCFAKMEQYFKSGKTVIYVSHSSDSVNNLCTRALLLDGGKMLLDGLSKMVTTFYLKMLYATIENRENVIDEIIEINNNIDKKKNFDENNQSEHKVDKPKKHDVNKLKPFFVPEFKPKTTVENRNYNVDIYDMCIKTYDGMKVNHLVSGERYIYEYKIRNNSITFDFVASGFEIKNKRGEKVSTIESGKLFRTGNYFCFQENSTKSYSHKFSCNLSTGIYFISIGVSSFNNGNQTVLNRLVDIDVFKVISDNSEYFGGVTNIFIT